MFKPQFNSVIPNASNIVSGVGSYTAAMFQEDYPQFYNKSTVDGTTTYTCYVPTAILTDLISQANACIQPDKWFESARSAQGLYVAHYATLYLRTYKDGSDSAEQAAQSGALVGVVSSAKLGDAEVTYSTDPLTKATADWGDLNATTYGQRLATKARLIGMGGSYAI